MQILDKSYQASDVVKNPALMNDYYGYGILIDVSMSNRYDNMVRALNVLAPDWEVVSTAKDDTRLIILVQRLEKPKRTDAMPDAAHG